MDLTVVYADSKYFASFHEALKAVASERVYIEMVEPKPLADVSRFQGDLIRDNYPVFYALDGERVVGWCDISVTTNPRLNHRGGLGMGIVDGYRRQGLGSKLMKAALAHARQIGLEKVELHVYTSNLAAIALYRRFGFEEEGLIKRYRKLDGRYFDCLMMGKFLAGEAKA
jgi:ribosomal protein S18 acetylase RimI-like enzyme